LLCALTLAGCAGQVDLSKSVTNRTTVKASGSFGDEALRMIEPCGLYTDDLIAGMGKKDPKAAAPDRRGYSECSYSIKDTAGKSDVRMSIKIGESLLAPPRQTDKQISGLLVYETRTSSGCTESAVTGRDPDRGITVQVLWDGGDPCTASVKLIDGAVKTIASNPPKYPDTPGSLVSLDPCAGIDDGAAASMLGEAPDKVPFGIRSCTFGTKDVAIDVRYNIDFEPFANNSSDKPTKVDLTDKVKGAAQWKDSISPNRCQIEWVHRALAGGRGENVNVSYQRSPADPAEDACAKVLPAARAVAAKLPQS
jgi:hypothetical protein